MGKAVEEYLRKFRIEERDEEKVGMGRKRKKKRSVQRLGGGDRNMRQRESDMVNEMRYYLMGWTYGEVAEKVNGENAVVGCQYKLTADNVRNDIEKELGRKVRLLRQEGGMDRLITKEAEKLDLLEKAAWDDYMKSREKKRTVKTADGGEVTETVRDSVGNPKFLDVLLRISERRGKLLGYDSPLQVDVTARQGGATRGYDFSKIPEKRLLEMADLLQGAKVEVKAEGYVVEDSGKSAEEGRADIADIAEKGGE